MKKFFLVCSVLLITMLVSPVAALDFSQFSFKNVKQTLVSASPQETTENVSQSEDVYDDSVRVMASASGNIISTTELSYIVGCVACEMPAAYHEEALKAQAVAAYTNLIRLKRNPDSTLGGADISDSPEKHQGYIDEEAQKQKWGDKYETYHQKIYDAVSAVMGKIIVYDNEPITAAYCAVCPGRTESALNIWQSDVPYLQSVASSGDRLSPDYSSTVVMTGEEFRTLTAADAEITLSENPAEWIGETVISDSGTGVIKSIVIGGKTLTGNKARSLFSLRSPSFTISYENDTFTFNVAGYGHCVGMSQYGADYLARQGSNYEDILKHYYKGTQVVSVR